MILWNCWLVLQDFLLLIIVHAYSVSWSKCCHVGLLLLCLDLLHQLVWVVSVSACYDVICDFSLIMRIKMLYAVVSWSHEQRYFFFWFGWVLTHACATGLKFCPKCDPHKMGTSQECICQCPLKCCKYTLYTMGFSITFMSVVLLSQNPLLIVPMLNQVIFKMIFYAWN